MIEADAHVAADARISPDAYIGHGTVIGSGVVIGARTKVWHHANILQKAVIGIDSMIAAWVQIDPYCIIGDRVRIQPHVALAAIIGDDVFIGPGTQITNAPYPPCKRLAQTVIEDGVVIGANVTLLPGIRIGRRAVIGSASIVTRSVPAEEVWFGQPAIFRFTRDGYDRRQAEWDAPQ